MDGESTMSDDTTKVSIRAAARLLDVSDTALHKANKRGRCTFNADGTVDVEKIRLQLAANTDPVRGGRRRPRHDSTAAAIQLPGTELPVVAPTITSARLRRELADARLAELDLAQKEGGLGDRAAMTAEYMRHVVAARQLLQAMPARLGPIVAAEQDAKKCAALIDAEVHRVCNELSNSDKA